MSRRRFLVTPEARQDLTEIWEYIAEDSVKRADQVLARLYDSLVQLAESPGMGHHRKGLADSRHRFWTVYSYVVVYRWETTPIQFIAVVHGARDLEAFLAQRIENEERPRN